MSEYHIAFVSEVHFKWGKAVRIQEKDIITALGAVRDEEQGRDIVSADMVSGIQIDGRDVLFMISVDPARGPSMEPLRQSAEAAVANIKGVKTVRAVLTAERQPEAPASVSDPHGMNKNPRLELPIKHIIAVASGKGGVGKSTVAFNIAHAMAQSGKSVGLLDADIYGPSVPLLTGLPNERPDFDDQNRILPHEAYGMKIMSIGFMVEDGTPMIWRGPMVQTAIYQMLRDVVWGTDAAPLDVLVIDMPPGTGDAQLTLAQKVPVSGAVIVTTPQDMALIDAKKAIAMFRKTDVPVLGLIENMSTHVCSNCGHEEHIFGHGGAKEAAQALDIPFLGDIPLEMGIRQASDSGQPVAERFTMIAGDLANQLDRL